MQIKCPNCGFVKELNENAIPKSAFSATCPKCQTKFQFREKTEISTEITQKTPIETKIPSVEHSNNQRIPTDKNTFQSPSEPENKPQENNTNDNELTEEEKKEKAFAAYNEQLKQLEELKKAGYTITSMTMVPFEVGKNANLNPFVAFFQTIIRVLFSSPGFFSTMFKPFPISKSVLFFIIVGMIQILAKQFWLSTYIDILSLESDPITQEALATISGNSSTVLLLFTAPFSLILQLFIFSSIFYAAVKLVQPQSADFSFLVRIIAYAYAPAVFSIIPILGDIIALIWFIMNIFIACRFALNMTWPRAYLTGSVVCIFIFLISYQILALLF